MLRYFYALLQKLYSQVNPSKGILFKSPLVMILDEGLKVSDILYTNILKVQVPVVYSIPSDS